MRKILNYLILIVLSLSFSSCLKSDLEDLPEYEDADITSVSSVRYRYISADKSPVSGENIVKEVDLSFQSSIDEEQSLVTINVTVPENFPASELANVSQSKILIAVGLSTAARLKPINDSPLLGVPGDWSKPNTYLVTAANGTTKQWTIKIGTFSK